MSQIMLEQTMHRPKKAAHTNTLSSATNKAYTRCNHKLITCFICNKKIVNALNRWAASRQWILWTVDPTIFRIWIQFGVQSWAFFHKNGTKAKETKIAFTYFLGLNYTKAKLIGKKDRHKFGNCIWWSIRICSADLANSTEMAQLCEPVNFMSIQENWRNICIKPKLIPF